MTLKQLKKYGLYTKLLEMISKYQANAESSDTEKAKGKDTLLKDIDKNGLRSTSVMKLIGKYQKEKILKPGLYKDVSELNKELKELEEMEAEIEDEESLADDGKTEDPSVEEIEDQSAEVLEEDDEEYVVDVETTPLVKTTEDLSTQEDIDKNSLSSDQEKALQMMMEKEEERLRKRLMLREAQLREKLMKRVTVRAKRLGVSSESMAEINKQNAIIKESREKITQLREDIKAAKEKIEQIRPKQKRSRKDKK